MSNSQDTAKIAIKDIILHNMYNEIKHLNSPPLI